MAILNGSEGLAHVEVEGDGVNWNGYMIFEFNSSNLGRFDAAGPTSKTVYEGPIFTNGKICFGHGTIKILKVKYIQKENEIRVEFRGIEQLTITRTFKDKPKDYLP